MLVVECQLCNLDIVDIDCTCFRLLFTEACVCVSNVDQGFVKFFFVEFVK